MASLANGLRVLETFTPVDQELGLSEIARRAGLDKWTANRLVITLTECGYLTRDAEARRYRLGTKVLDLGFAVLDGLEIRQLALPFLKSLHRRTGETVNMAILDDVDIVCIERLRGVHTRLSVDVGVGTRLPAHATAQGKLLLAYLDEADLELRIERMKFEQIGPNTIANDSALRHQLAEIRDQGFSLNLEESEAGLYGVAAPILDRDGAALASVNIAVPAGRVSHERLLTELKSAVVETAAAISAASGYRPNRASHPSHASTELVGRENP